MNKILVIFGIMFLFGVFSIGYYLGDIDREKECIEGLIGNLDFYSDKYKDICKYDVSCFKYKFEQECSI